MPPIRNEDRGDVRFSCFEKRDICGGDFVEGFGRPKFGLDYDRTIAAVIDLGRAVCVVEKTAVLIRVPLICVALAGLDVTTREAGDTVGPGRIQLSNSYIIVNCFPVLDSI